MFEKIIDGIGDAFEEIFDGIDSTYDDIGYYMEDFLDWLFRQIMNFKEVDENLRAGKFDTGWDYYGMGEEYLDFLFFDDDWIVWDCIDDEIWDF